MQHQSASCPLHVITEESDIFTPNPVVVGKESLGADACTVKLSRLVDKPQTEDEVEYGEYH